jgi:hypothetical protein
MKNEIAVKPSCRLPTLKHCKHGGDIGSNE